MEQFFVVQFFLFQDDFSSRNLLLWIDMPWYLRTLHILKQIPCYILLFLYPLFSHCCPWTQNVSTPYYMRIFNTIFFNSKTSLQYYYNQ